MHWNADAMQQHALCSGLCHFALRANNKLTGHLDAAVASPDTNKGHIVTTKALSLVMLQALPCPCATQQPAPIHLHQRFTDSARWVRKVGPCDGRASASRKATPAHREHTAVAHPPYTSLCSIHQTGRAPGGTGSEACMCGCAAAWLPCCPAQLSCSRARLKAAAAAAATGWLAAVQHVVPPQSQLACLSFCFCCC